MRPKKVVLCVAESEVTLSVQVFQLDTWGYRAVRASSVVEALSILQRARLNSIDLLMIHERGVYGFPLLLEEAKRLQPLIKTIVLSDKPASFGNSTADLFIPKGMASPIELHERMRILLARKRGPKPAEKKSVVSVQLPDEKQQEVA